MASGEAVASPGRGGRMLRHLWSRTRLERLVDAELTGPDATKVQHHLVECPGCEAEVAALLGLKTALRSRVGLSADPAAIDRLERWISKQFPSVLP